MAATVTSATQNPSAVNQAIAYQTFVVNTDVDTSFTVTPTQIKAIYNVAIIPTNAAAATGLTSTYLNGFTLGSGSVVIATVASATFLVTVSGTIA